MKKKTIVHDKNSSAVFVVSIRTWGNLQKNHFLPRTFSRWVFSEHFFFCVKREYARNSWKDALRFSFPGYSSHSNRKETPHFFVKQERGINFLRFIISSVSKENKKYRRIFTDGGTKRLLHNINRFFPRKENNDSDIAYKLKNNLKQKHETWWNPKKCLKILE